jgi:hypothetical protein
MKAMARRWKSAYKLGAYEYEGITHVVRFSQSLRSREQDAYCIFNLQAMQSGQHLAGSPATPPLI